MIKKVLPFIVLLFFLVSCATVHEQPEATVVVELPDITESVQQLFDSMPDDETQINLTDPMIYYWDIAYNSMEFAKAADRWRDFSGQEEAFIEEVASDYPVDLEQSYSVVFALIPTDSEKTGTDGAVIAYYYSNFVAFVQDYMNWKGYGLSLSEYIQALAELEA